MPRLPKVASGSGFAAVQAAQRSPVLAITRTLPADLETPLGAYLKIAEGAAYSFLLESVEGAEHAARFCFMGANPSMVARGMQGKTSLERSEGTDELPLPLTEFLREHFRGRALPPMAATPFVGGAVGYLTYETAPLFDPAMQVRTEAREGVVMLFRTAVTFDRVRQTLVITSLVFPEEAGEDAGQLRRLHDSAEAEIDAVAARLRRPIGPLACPSMSRPDPELPSSNFSQTGFEAAVREIKERILAGDCYQVVISQRFQRTTTADPVAVYRALRRMNPSPYMFLFRASEESLIGASPEMLVRCRDGQLSYRPIAGTCRRGATAEENEAFAARLLADQKERAEHVMLVDLGRNDLGRVAEFGSVEVTRLMEVERYSHVQHLVSHIEARLRPEMDAFDALAACFPAGTVTGAPKVAAAKVIQELEPEARGPYAGSVFYRDYAGNLDACIAIRMLHLRDGLAQVQAGAGIVADSEPAREYEETLNKARGMWAALAAAEAAS